MTGAEGAGKFFEGKKWGFPKKWPKSGLKTRVVIAPKGGGSKVTGWPPDPE